MDEITQWFLNGCDFHTGVAIYNALPKTKAKVIRSLDRGKSSYNKSLLIKELRRFKNAPVESPKPQRKYYDVKNQPKPYLGVTDAAINKQNNENSQKQKALKIEYGSVKYGDLPKELRPRFRELGRIFYEMCDLKFILNDLHQKEEKQALHIQLQIEELDDQRVLIWNEINHWQTHRKLLPTEADSFKGLNSDQLRTEKSKLESNKSRKIKRVNIKYEELFNTTDKESRRKIENSINRTERLIHQDKLNINKINELL